MSRKIRFTTLSFVILMIFALPVTALANKRVYTASLHGASGGSGSAILGVLPDGTVRFFATVRNLTGDPTSIQVKSAVDGSVLLNVCSGSGCPANNSSFTKDLPPSSLAPGVTAAEFSQLLDAEQAYVSVSTAANPGGEISGTLLRQ